MLIVSLPEICQAQLSPSLYCFSRLSSYVVMARSSSRAVKTSPLHDCKYSCERRRRRGGGGEGEGEGEEEEEGRRRRGGGGGEEEEGRRRGR